MAKLLKKRMKKGRPPSAETMAHTGVVLPNDLLQRLKGNGASSGRGLSGEIRHRLQIAYEQEARDPETRYLVECTEHFADSLERDLNVPWHQTEFGRSAMKAGLLVLLREYDTGSDKAPAAPWSGYPDDAPPEVVAETHMRLVMRAHPRKHRQ